MKIEKALDMTMARDEVRRLIATLGWEKYHTPRNLAIAISVESSELLAQLQWLTDQEIDQLFGDASKQSDLLNEIADITINLLSLSDILKVDLNQVTVAKCKRIVQRFANRKGFPHGANRNDLFCAKCDGKVLAEWRYCACCGFELQSPSSND